MYPVTQFYFVVEIIDLSKSDHCNLFNSFFTDRLYFYFVRGVLRIFSIYCFLFQTGHLYTDSSKISIIHYLIFYCRKTLSQQKHYDWGLRALKTVVGGCKAALKSMKSTQTVNINELSLVVYALRLNTLSKLTFSDSQQFDELISCTFQDVEFNMFKDDNISAAIENSFHALGLQFNARQV